VYLFGATELYMYVGTLNLQHCWATVRLQEIMTFTTSMNIKPTKRSLVSFKWNKQIQIILKFRQINGWKTIWSLLKCSRASAS